MVKALFPFRLPLLGFVYVGVFPCERVWRWWVYRKEGKEKGDSWEGAVVQGGDISVLGQGLMYTCR